MPPTARSVALPRRRDRPLGGLFGVLLLTPPVAPAETLTLGASADATLYQADTAPGANGAGDWLFAGVTRTGSTRRALLRFDLAALPAGATVEAVTLRLSLERDGSNAQSSDIAALHRLARPWSEGPADPPGNESAGAPAVTDDSTWLYARHDDRPWSTPGGDFAAEPSATTALPLLDGGPATVSFVSSGSEASALLNDVRGWVAASPNGDNHGWVLRIEEQRDGGARRLASRENGVYDGPELSIEYRTGGANGEPVFADDFEPAPR